MLPGNLQYWKPCKWEKLKEDFDVMYSFDLSFDELSGEYKGTIDNDINEPIHFCGPSPGDESAITEEEKKEEP